MEQLTLFKVNNKKVKKRSPYIKPDKIKQNLKTWNTIKHIYRYQTFYKICSALYLLTFDNQLECLDYYSETEIDNDKIYTIKYAIVEETMALSIKDRVLRHIELLRRVKNNDSTLEHDIKKIDNDYATLF